MLVSLTAVLEDAVDSELPEDEKLELFEDRLLKDELPEELGLDEAELIDESDDRLLLDERELEELRLNEDELENDRAVELETLWEDREVLDRLD